MINQLLNGNQNFVEKEFNQHSEYYGQIAVQQQPVLLWIGCSDSRVSEDLVTNSKPGTIFVHRNVANIVAFNDVNIASIIEYATQHLKIPDIVVCGHTKCGGIQAIEDGVKANYIGDWLLIASGAKEAADRIAKEQNLTREQKLGVLCRENVKLQIKHLKNLSLIKNLDVKPRIHGWVYDVETGKIEVLVDGRS